MAEQTGVSITQKPYVMAGIFKDTPSVSIFTLRSQDGSKLSFDPGMFVMVTCNDSTTGEKITRAYSIASLPDSDTLELYISMVHGKFTSKLETAKEGDIYYVTGPYGQFRFSPKQDRKVLFIAGGTGIAPFMSMLKQIKGLNTGNDIVLLYSVKYPNEIIRRAELEQLGTELALRTVITVTRPQEGDGWDGETGHIDSEMIKRAVPDLPERSSYLCGPLGFVKAVKDSLVALQYPAERIKMDVWG
jgi:ferredoxin-NADP reductase